MLNFTEYRYRLRRALAATWAAINDVLLDGEVGWERDTGKLKVGNGVDGWNDRNYIDRSIELSLLRDVNTTGRLNAQALFWDEASQKHVYASVSGASANPQSDLSAAILALSPKVYYKCDEAAGSTTLADSSGNGMDLTIFGTCYLDQCELVKGGGSFAAPTSSTSANGATRADRSGITVPVNYDYTQFVVAMRISSSNNIVMVWELATLGETEATNAQCAFQFNSITTGVQTLSTIWEYGAGSNEFFDGPMLPVGIPFAATVRKTSATKTLDFFVDGDHIYSVNYVHEPTGGSSTYTLFGANNPGTAVSYFLGSNFAFFDYALTDAQIKSLAAAAGFSR